MKNIALFVLVVGGLSACGDVINHRREDAGGPQDAKGDSAPDAAGAATVNIVTQGRIYDNGAKSGQAVPHIVVIAANPDETIGAMTTTDLNGSGSITTVDGGSITAIYPDLANSQVNLVTYLGVKDADKLTFGAYVYADQNTLGTLNVNWTAFAGAASYTVYSSCDSQSVGVGVPTTAALTMSDSCTDLPIDVQVVAYNGASPAVPIAYGQGSATTFVSPQTMAIGALTTIPSMTATATDIPDVVTEASARVGTFTYYDSQLDLIESNGAPTGNAYSLAGKIAPGFARLVGSLWMERSGGGFGNTYLYDSLAAGSTTWNLAVPNLTPWLTAQIAPAASNEILWFTEKTATASRADVVSVQINWNHTDTTVTPNVTTSYNWTFYTPPDQTVIKFPALTGAAAMYLPASTDYLGQPFVTLIQIPSLTNGYDGARALPERDLSCPLCAVSTGEVPRIIENYMQEDD